MIFDTHCHLGFAEEAPQGVHERARDAGVSRLLTVGIDLPSSEAASELSAALEGVEFAAGLHPNSADQLEEQWDGLQALCRRPECRAVGETGMDFFWDRTTPAQQQVSLERHLQLAAEIRKPVVVHCRDAFPETFRIIGRHPDVHGIMHCFAGGVEEARQALDLGYYLSFAGPLTYPRSDDIRAAARFAPEERLLVETDAPFLPPQGRRGETNEPAFIRTTVQMLAQVRGTTFEHVAAATMSNACRLLGLAPRPGDA